MGKKIWLNGNLVDADQAKISVFDHGLLYGDGVFEGIRSYGGRLLKLATHLRRLAQSARSIRLEMPYTTDELADAIRQTVRANGCENGYIRICVTRGIGTLGLNPLTCKDSTVFVIADSITLYPEEYYQNGMGVITASTIRNHPAALSPRIKSMNYLNNIMAKVEALDAGCMEAVMLNHVGNVAECTGDNIFIVRNTPAPTPGSATGGSGGDDGTTPPDDPPVARGDPRGRDHEHGDRLGRARGHRLRTVRPDQARLVHRRRDVPHRHRGRDSPRRPGRPAPDRRRQRRTGDPPAR